MEYLLPLTRPSLPQDSLLQSSSESLHPPADAAWGDRRAGARSASSWFSRRGLPNNIDVDDDDESDTWCCCEPLNNTERILGWLTCFLGGLILSAVSMGSFNDMLLGKNNKFAVTYTIGNIIGLAGTAFLVGALVWRTIMLVRRSTAHIGYGGGQLAAGLVNVEDYHSKSEYVRIFF
ncbi:hypothetical protein, conserved [Eimeria maxima]|uniref:Vesicle transport protein n=1 Tax=Eimeria maxima TaxID=5804 RepID=U6M2C3_EIMMA|nr:hypothetical protein, conserved [Eimeria maxima]CDJ58392.1 hypothetical protein, conserved [Eimeria maxima]